MTIKPQTECDQNTSKLQHGGLGCAVVRRCFHLLTVCALGVLGNSSLVQAINFSDNFESATLDPFWTISAVAGSVTFPSTVRAHSGSQSVQLNSLQGAGEKGISLRHALAQPTYGQVSVWMYDSGADLSSANYMGLHCNVGYLQTSDYDLGPSNGGTYNGAAANGSGFITAVDRTQAWHQFAINSTESALTMSIDGTTVYSGAGGTPFTGINLVMYGPTWRPAWSAEFDDFQFVPVPEPSTWALGSLGLIGLWFVRRRKA